VPYILNLSLREALFLAKAGDVITFDAKLFNDDGTAKNALVLKHGELTVKNSVQIIGTGVTINAHEASRIFSVNGGKAGNCTVELVGFTLTDGHADYGGALFLTNCTVTMTDCTMTNNTGKWGGVIYQSGGALTMTGVTASQNNATWGGAIYQLGSDSELLLDDVELSGNTATWGGGLYQASGTATLTERTVISGNFARNSYGKAVVKAKGATLTIKNSITGEETAAFDHLLARYLDEIESYL
jgi:hypothetical protein